MAETSSIGDELKRKLGLCMMQDWISMIKSVIKVPHSAKNYKINTCKFDLKNK
jgi:hypothetical protein